ncbi:MAG: hypothetical protein R3343_10150 [Nitriliruptorales bacterium]|nr:hypothetical protein [Nitriliruptorales bacterium]
MRFEELRFVCTEAAKDVVTQHGDDPIPPTVVLPGAERTRLLTLPGFPEEDRARHEYMVQFAEDEITSNLVPAWGFIAAAEDAEGNDVVVAVYGARRHQPELTAARLDEDGTLGEFVTPEELDPTAMPFLHPLQHAVDAIPPLDDPSEAEGLPLFGE